MKKRVLAALTAFCLGCSLMPATVPAAEFDDTQGHRGESSIDRRAGYGVLNGDGGFNPDGEKSDVLK